MKIKYDVLHKNFTANIHIYRISLLFNHILIIRMQNKEIRMQNKKFTEVLVTRF